MNNTILLKGRRLLCLCVAILMIASLSACSQKNDDRSDLPSSRTSTNEPEDSGFVDEDTAPEALSPSFDEIMNAVLQYAENEGLQLTDDADSTISKMYSNGETDAYSIFKHLCATGLCVAPSSGGILVMGYESGKYYNYNSTGTFKCQTFTVHLDFIDPETGTITPFRTFSSESTHSCSGEADFTTPTKAFDSSFTRMTAYLTLEDGAKHVGWIDESGSFTDVSAMITAESGGFSGLTKHSAPCFGPNDYFYFRDETNTNVQIKRVPLNKLTPSAVETLVDNVAWKGADVTPLPDGSVVDTSIQYYYYDEKLLYPAPVFAGQAWISQSESVGYENGMIYRYTLTGKTGVYDWYSERNALVPSVKDRENWNPVVSPDRSQVAFLSRLKTGTDQTGHLFIVSADGGDPVTVPTEYSFPNSLYMLVGWYSAD